MFKVYFKINCSDNIPYAWLPDVKEGHWGMFASKVTRADAEKEVAWMQNELEGWDVEYKIEEDGVEIWKSRK